MSKKESGPLQLTLHIALRDFATFDNFVPGPNSEALAQLRRVSGEKTGLMFIQGPEGCGKTHLLNAAARAAREAKRSSLYLSQALVNSDDGDWLDVPGEGLICIDDVSSKLSARDASALFLLYERSLEQGGSLVLASKWAPNQIRWNLPDLHSRIQGGLVYRLQNLSENQLAEALTLRARERGFGLGTEVLSYILRRYHRDTKSLFALLDRIDQASLARKRKVTVPLVQLMEADSVD